MAVGRPLGWRKKDSRGHSVMIRLSDQARAWLMAESEAAGLTESEIVRQLIEQRMSETTKEKSHMRGFSQVGHNAVVVWSPTHRMHVSDLQVQLDRGCTERPNASFQQAGGIYFSWLNAPAGRCELCGGRCRLRS